MSRLIRGLQVQKDGWALALRLECRKERGLQNIPETQGGSQRYLLSHPPLPSKAHPLCQQTIPSSIQTPVPSPFQTHPLSLPNLIPCTG